MNDAAAWHRERNWLGYAGLLPFVAATATILITAPGELREAAVDGLRHYAALIASFLGAVHWGVAATPAEPLRAARLRWGVMPALLAWTLLMLPDSPGLAGLAVLLLLVLLVDLRLLPLLDEAYRALRLRLSLLASLALLIAAASTAAPP